MLRHASSTFARLAVSCETPIPEASSAHSTAPHHHTPDSSSAPAVMPPVAMRPRPNGVGPAATSPPGAASTPLSCEYCCSNAELLLLLRSVGAADARVGVCRGRTRRTVCSRGAAGGLQPTAACEQAMLGAGKRLGACKPAIAQRISQMGRRPRCACPPLPLAPGSHLRLLPAAGCSLIAFTRSCRSGWGSFKQAGSAAASCTAPGCCRRRRKCRSRSLALGRYSWHGSARRHIRSSTTPRPTWPLPCAQGVDS